MTKIKLLLLSVCVMLSAVFIGATTNSVAFADTHDDHEHWWHITEYVEPTCTEDGYTEHHCYYCDDVHRDNYIDALGHSFLEIVIEPTCTARGYTTHFCTVCGFEYVDNYTEPLGHDFVSEVIEPTCVSDGYTLYTCQRDGFSYKDNYNYAFGHYYTEDVLEPTCTESGYTTYTCIHCGDTYIDNYTEPHGHHYHEYVTEPTCVAYGYTEHICEECGDRFVTDYIKPHGHDYEKIVIKPTENSAGYTINVCKDCGYSYLSDFVTSGDEHFEEHNHEYSLFVARYDVEERFIVQNYCECGEVDNSFLKIIFIDESGNYTFLTPNYSGEVRYNHLYGDYNVYILNEHGEMLSNFKVRAGAIPEVHTHDYTLTVIRNDEDKYFTVSYDCDCGEMDNSLLSIIFFDGNGGYITLSADGFGKVDYSALMHGDYSVFILNNNGEMLSSFTLTIPEEIIPEEHFHDFLLSVTNFEDEKRFTVQYVCRCGEVQNGVFKATFIDGNGNSVSITSDEFGNISYSQLNGNYNVFVFNGNGEMLNSFKLTVDKEHIHEHKLTIVINDSEKYLTVNYLCDCGDIDPTFFHVIFIDGNGDSQTLNVSANGKVDYSTLSSGNYTVYILNNYGEILESFNLTVAEDVIHYHDYSLTVTRLDDEKYFTVQYLCDCDEVNPAVFQVLFTDKDGNYLTLTADEFGKVDYSNLASGNYNVFILGSNSEMLTNFKLTIAEEVIHIHDYSLSITRYDDDKYFTVQYVCECGEIQNSIFRATFIGENGGSVIIYADANGKIDYSELVGAFNVFVTDNNGVILDTFSLTVEPQHTHEYSLTLTRNDSQKYFVIEYTCECGADQTDTVYAIFMDETGAYITLTANEYGKVDYSFLIGKYNIYIMNSEGKLLSNFRLTIAPDIIHNHLYELKVTRFEREKYFVVQYICECGEIENAVFRVMFVDENGDYTTLNVTANGEVFYSHLVGNFSVFVLNGQGEMLTSFKLSVPEEVIHNHHYSLSVVRNDEEKYFIVKSVCECGEVDSTAIFNIMFIAENGEYITLTVDIDGKVDYSTLVDSFNVFIQSGTGEILSNFRLSVAEEHTHSFVLTVTDNIEERYFTLKNICDCGEAESLVYHAIFIDENGNSITKTASSNGDVSYTELVGNYNVFILDNYGEMLTSFTMQIEAAHVHEYTYSLTIRDGEQCFVIKYACECGEVENVVLYAVFIDGNGSYTTLYPNENGIVDYSSINGKYTVLVQNGNGEILSNFTLTVGTITEPPVPHTHEYSLVVTRYDEESYFVLNTICECGEDESVAYLINTLDKFGFTISLAMDENDKVDYSDLASGAYTVYVSDVEGNVLSTLQLTVTDEEIPNEPNPPVENDMETPENSVLPTILAIMLVLLAVGAVTVFILKKIKNINKNNNK